MATTSIQNSLGQNAFLQLLVTQLKYQNPLQPTDNQQFIAQLAQFSSLEQMTNVSTGETHVLNQLQAMGATMSTSTGFDMLGLNVTAAVNGSSIQGTVTGVQFANGGVQLQVGNQSVNLSDVQSISK